MAEQADVVVVGLGPGGEDVAGRLAEAGLDVVGVEAELVGGECPYWGCVPSKMMIRAAQPPGRGAARRRHGRVRRASSPTGRRWRRASATRRPTTGTTRSPSSASSARAVDSCGAGDASTGPGAWWSATGARGAHARVVINIGTRSWTPPIEGLAGTPYWTNREAIEATEVPAIARGHRRRRDRRRARPGRSRASARTCHGPRGGARDSSRPRSPRRASCSTAVLRPRGDRAS